MKLWCLLWVEPSKDVDLESLDAILQTVSLQRFGSREALYLEKQIAEVDGHRLAVLIEEQPLLVVVTDDPHNNWSERLRKADCDVSIMTVEPFQHGENYVLRVNGSYPSDIGATVVGTCNDYPSLPTSLVVTWCSGLPRPEPSVLEISYGGTVTRWQVLHGNPDLVLIPNGSSPLQEEPPFELLQETDGRYSTQKSNGRGKQSMKVSIGPEIISSYKRLSYTAWHALAEFVDNSVQSYINNSKRLDRLSSKSRPPLTVRISYRQAGGGLLTIRDNAMGMSGAGVNQGPSDWTTS